MHIVKEYSDIIMIVNKSKNIVKRFIRNGYPTYIITKQAQAEYCLNKEHRNNSHTNVFVIDSDDLQCINRKVPFFMISEDN